MMGELQTSASDEIKLYDTVRIKAFRHPVDVEPDKFNRRPPRVGDIACVIEIYANPPGYELECSDGNGITEWLHAFSPEDIELDRIT
jgi:hypothetical protein